MSPGQAEVHFDVIGGIYAARCKHLFVHIVAQQAWQGILEDLLSVLHQTNLVRSQLIAVRRQDCFQRFHAQCIWRSRAEEDATMSFISDLLDGQARAVCHHCENGECLGQGKLGVEHFGCIVISSFGRNARGQIQVAHRHVTVTKAEKALTVAFAGRPGFRGMKGCS